MAVVEIQQGGAKKIIGATGDNKSWVGDIISIVKEVNSLVTSINNNPFVKRFLPEGESQTTLGSGNTGKSIKRDRKAPAPAEASKEPKAESYNEEDLSKYFSTPEGLQQIGIALDKVAEMFGEDTKVSDLKELLKLASGGNKNENRENGVKEKAGADTKKSTSNKKKAGATN